MLSGVGVEHFVSDIRGFGQGFVTFGDSEHVMKLELEYSSENSGNLLHVRSRAASIAPLVAHYITYADSRQKRTTECRTNKSKQKDLVVLPLLVSCMKHP